ncbi:MAG: T9SS type A sorting domain-containing protein [Bacteroidia bacterium]
MKKIYLIISIIFMGLYNSNAQTTPPCENGCIEVSKGTYIAEICKYNWIGYYINPAADPLLYPGGIVPLSITNAPCVFIMVNYTIFNCNGISKLQIDGTVFIDNTNAFNQSYSDPSWTGLSPSIGCIISNTTPCTFISNPANIIQAQINAINKLVASLGIPANLDTYFKGSCNSLVEIQWPAGAFITYPPGGDNPTGGPITVNLSNSTTTESVPCNEACCKVTYEYRIRTASNGETEHYYQPTYAPADETCSNSPLPNYNTYPNRLSATVIDPITGLSSTVYGTVIGQHPCELICNKYNAPPPTGCFTTDVKDVTKTIPLEFSANPTLVNNFIKFTTSKMIKNVMVFDMTGKKVMNITTPDSNELNTAELKEGTYFIQVYFTDNSVKTIKVVKH